VLDSSAVITAERKKQPVTELYLRRPLAPGRPGRPKKLEAIAAGKSEMPVCPRIYCSGEEVGAWC
jgi:hypothetical protein